MLITRGYCFEVFYLDDTSDVFQAFKLKYSLLHNNFTRLVALL